MKIYRSLFPIPRSLFILLLIFSCKTIPVTTDFSLIEILPLDRGALVYVVANAKEAESIIALIPIEQLNSKQAVQMLNKTNIFAAALFPLESGRRFQLAAWGNYPDFGASIGFNFAKDWKKQRVKSGVAFWYSAADKFSVALNSRQAFAASWIDDIPASPIAASPGIEYPEGFNDFQRNAPFSCWLEDPAQMFNRILEDMGLPLQMPAEMAFINVFSTGEKQFEAEMRLQFKSSAQAQGIAALLTLARNFGGGLTVDKTNPNSVLFSLFFSKAPVHNGQNLDIKTGALTEEETALLFKMFLLY